MGSEEEKFKKTKEKFAFFKKKDTMIFIHY